MLKHSAADSQGSASAAGPQTAPGCVQESRLARVIFLWVPTGVGSKFYLCF